MKKLIFKIIKITGLPYLFRELIQRNKVSILMFHDVKLETAQKVFPYLADKYNIIGLDTFIDSCEKKDNTGIPKKALIITFDDGHIRNFELLPVFQQLNIPVTIFLCAGIINTNRHYWFKYPNLPIPVEELKRKKNKQRLELLARAGFTPEQEFGFPQALSDPQIEQMKHQVNLQSHTVLHPCLPMCSDEEAREEIFTSKEILETKYGVKINAIAYPNGDYSDREIALSKAAGYKCGLTTKSGFNTIQSNLFELKRLDPNDTDDLNEFIVKSSGTWGFLKPLFKTNKLNNG